MRNEQRLQYNSLRDDRLPHVVRDVGLTGLSKQVAFSAGLGDAIVHRREAELARKAKRSAQKAARRRNR